MIHEILQITIPARTNEAAECVLALVLTSTIICCTFIDIFTGLGIVKQLVPGWALTVVASSMIKTGMTAAAIIDITFIDILANLFVAGLKFKSRVTFTVEASSGVDAVVITSTIAVRAFVYVFTSDLVASKKVPFVACTHVTAWNIHTQLVAAPIIDLAFVDVSTVFAVRKQVITSPTRASYILSLAHVKLSALVFTTSFIYRAVHG